MTVRLTERDVRLLAKCRVARWLTTTQVQKSFFSKATPDAVRKRLRKLTESGYLQSYQPNQMTEALHALGPKGKPVLEGKGFEVDLEKAPPKQLEHFIGINDIRVAVECGGLRIVYFFAAWELGALGWLYQVIPDAVFAVENGGRSTFVVEYDRGTETMEQFSKKIRAYERGLEGFPFDAVLIVAETEGRLESLCRYVRKRAFSERTFLATPIAKIREAGIFSRVFVDVSGGTGGLRNVSLRDFGGLPGGPGSE